MKKFKTKIPNKKLDHVKIGPFLKKKNKKKKQKEKKTKKQSIMN